MPCTAPTLGKLVLRGSTSAQSKDRSGEDGARTRRPPSTIMCRLLLERPVIEALQQFAIPITFDHDMTSRTKLDRFDQIVIEIHV